MKGKQRVNCKANKPALFVEPPGAKKEVPEKDDMRLRIETHPERMIRVRDAFGNLFVLEVPGKLPLTYRDAMNSGELICYQLYDASGRDISFKNAKTCRPLPFIATLRELKAVSVADTMDVFIRMMEEKMPVIPQAPKLSASIKGAEKLASLKEKLPMKPATPPLLPDTFKDYKIHAPVPRSSGLSPVPYGTKEIPCHLCNKPIPVRARLTMKDGVPIAMQGNTAMDEAACSRRIKGVVKWFCGCEATNDIDIKKLPEECTHAGVELLLQKELTNATVARPSTTARFPFEESTILDLMGMLDPKNKEISDSVKVGAAWFFVKDLMNRTNMSNSPTASRC